VCSVLNSSLCVASGCSVTPPAKSLKPSTSGMYTSHNTMSKSPPLFFNVVSASAPLDADVTAHRSRMFGEKSIHQKFLLGCIDASRVTDALGSGAPSMNVTEILERATRLIARCSLMDARRRRDPGLRSDATGAPGPPREQKATKTIFSSDELLIAPHGMFVVWQGNVVEQVKTGMEAAGARDVG